MIAFCGFAPPPIWKSPAHIRFAHVQQRRAPDTTPRTPRGAP